MGQIIRDCSTDTGDVVCRPFGPDPKRQAATFTSLYPNGPHGQRRSSMSKKLEGKVAVITGGNSGIELFVDGGMAQV
jgi:hypothetical protein